MIDFHCHLDLYPDPQKVLERVNRENMYVLAVTTTPRAWQGTRKLVDRAPRVRIALGLHPQLIPERHDEVELFCSLLHETRYVGEVGIDGSGQFRRSLALQQEVFLRILDACAKAGGRILSVHSRGAARVVLDALESNPDSGIAVLHWFSGTVREFERAIELGCWFSVGPAMLAGKKGTQLAGAMPRDRVLTETDGPFANNQGVPLNPWDVGSAVKHLSKVWRMTIAEATGQIAGNWRRLLNDRGACEEK